MADPLRVLSLCSGAGMLDIGVELGLAYLGVRSRVLGYVERDAYAASRILARMEEQALEPAPVFVGDLADVGWSRFRGMVELVVAGFPCQPVSSAGRRRATDDDRWIWPDIAAALRALRPRLVFLENVRGLLAGYRGLDRVFATLAELGFDAQWSVLSAAAVGASHRRERIFILAYDEHARLGLSRPAHHDDRGDAPGHDADRCGADLADPNPRLVSFSRPRSQGRARARPAGAVLVDAECARPQGPRHSWPARERVAGAPSADGRDVSLPLFAPGPLDPRWTGLIADRPDLAPAVEPGLRMLADGLARVVDESRADQLRTVGNGVVATQAACAFVELARRAGLL